MRGAALKLGQMLSIQDMDAVPVPIQQLLTKLHDGADAMPPEQMEKVMSEELGEWRSKFSSFDMTPIAAASIGQVHQAKVGNEHVAVKVQYPGVAESILSDLDSLKWLLNVSMLLPRGLFLERTIEVAKSELGREMDYRLEADAIERFRELLSGHRHIGVPKVYRDLSTKRVLVMEYVAGLPVSRVVRADQETKNHLAEQLLILCLRELFEFRFMQTDPNWSNFLYDPVKKRINLVDFGASREFSEEFTSGYKKLLKSAVAGDRDGAVLWSQRLGFLTGDETEEMISAHIAALMTLATPFATKGKFDFSKQTISQEVRKQIPTMLRYRLTPPPEETYSLHRKLSGCFMLCSKLNAKIDCSRIFNEYTA